MADDAFGLVGKVLGGQFRVDEVVGEGGFSVVYKGFHMGLKEPVAIKCLRLPQLEKKELADQFGHRFRDESRIAYRLSQGNLNIARSITSGTTTDTKGNVTVPYMVLEWLAGDTLAADFKKRRDQNMRGRTLGETMALFAPAAEALGYAHSHGVIHRDVKPQNLFLAQTREGTRLKVLDFGMAKIVSDGTLGVAPLAQSMGQNMPVFSPPYAAPEQFDWKVGLIGTWTDVYSLAIVMLEALADKRVRVGESLAEAMVQACDPKRTINPREHCIALGDAMAGVFTRALSLKPKDRPQDMSEFWAALSNAQKADAARMPPPPEPEDMEEAKTAINDTRSLFSEREIGRAVESLKPSPLDAARPASDHDIPRGSLQTKTAPHAFVPPGAPMLATPAPVAAAHSPSANPNLAALRSTTVAAVAPPANPPPAAPPPVEGRPHPPTATKSDAPTAIFNPKNTVMGIGSPPVPKQRLDQTLVSPPPVHEGPAPNRTLFGTGPTEAKPPQSNRGVPPPSQTATMASVAQPQGQAPQRVADGPAVAPRPVGQPVAMPRPLSRTLGMPGAPAPPHGRLSTPTPTELAVQPLPSPGLSGAPPAPGPGEPTTIPAPAMAPPIEGAAPQPASARMVASAPMYPGNFTPAEPRLAPPPAPSSDPMPQGPYPASMPPLPESARTKALQQQQHLQQMQQQQQQLYVQQTQAQQHDPHAFGGRPAPQPGQQPLSQAQYPTVPSVHNAQMAAVAAAQAQQGPYPQTAGYAPVHGAYGAPPASPYGPPPHMTEGYVNVGAVAKKPPTALLIAAAAMVFAVISGVVVVLIMVLRSRSADADKPLVPEARATPSPAEQRPVQAGAAQSVTAAATPPPAVTPPPAPTPDPVPPQAPTAATPAPEPEPAKAPEPAAAAKAPTPVAAPKPDRPLATPTPAPAPKPAAPPADPKAFNPDSAKTSLQAMEGILASCKKPDGPTGPGKVRVTFGNSGTVSRAVMVGAPYEGNPVGDCAASRFRMARVAPFEGAPGTIDYSFRINK